MGGFAECQLYLELSGKNVNQGGFLSQKGQIIGSKLLLNNLESSSFDSFKSITYIDKQASQTPELRTPFVVICKCRGEKIVNTNCLNRSREKFQKSFVRNSPELLPDGQSGVGHRWWVR